MDIRELRNGRGLTPLFEGKLLQILACLTGCELTAEAVNLIDNGKRNDIYELGANYMNNLGANVDRDTLKTPIMTTFYASQAKPKQIFGEGTPLLQAYYDMLENRCRGAYRVIPVILSLHNPEALNYRWTLPDSHVANVTVKKKKDTKIEVAELGGVSFTFRHEINAPKNEPDDFDVSLLANMVQSYDAYIERQLVLRAADSDIQVDSIFDCFNASPNNMEFVRRTYVELLAEIANSDALNQFIYEINPNFNGSWIKYTDNLADSILQANYALS